MTSGTSWAPRQSPSGIQAGPQTSYGGAKRDNTPPFADGSGGDGPAQAASQPSLWSRGGPMRVQLSLDCLMQVSVASACERYLRVWLERLDPPLPTPSVPTTSDKTVLTGSRGGGSPSPPSPSPLRDATAISSNPAVDSVILPPGDSTPLKCFLRPAPFEENPPRLEASASARHAGSGLSVAVAGPSEEPDRLVAAEAVVGSWAVSWRMIGLEDDAPHGSIQLSTVDVARVREAGHARCKGSDTRLHVFTEQWSILACRHPFEN